MALPIELQNIHAAGVYRLLFDKSQIQNVPSNILRLVVGYSEKGPFNTPVFIAQNDTTAFRTLFGDISKKQEKRGIMFHRLAMQSLERGPIIALNLKKFDGETVTASSISTDFNIASGSDPITTVKLKVEDIYDTTRFWTLNPEKINDLVSEEGVNMKTGYINITETQDNGSSVTYFIRKTVPTNTLEYNVTVNDWYVNDNQEIPAFLENKKDNLISDFFAEIYVFKGKFTESQVLSSDTLRNYFTIDIENGEKKLKLRPYVTNAYGDVLDTLEQLYKDPNSNALGHWSGSLIPEFKNKQGSYVSLDILFNQDTDTTGLMMSFNEDALYEEDANIDLSGRNKIPTQDILTSRNANKINGNLTLDKLFNGTAVSSVLGNLDSPVISDKITFSKNIGTINGDKIVPTFDFSADDTHLYGTLFVKEVKLPSTDVTSDMYPDVDYTNKHLVDETKYNTHKEEEQGKHKISLQQVGNVAQTVEIKTPNYIVDAKDVLNNIGEYILKSYYKVDENNNPIVDDKKEYITAWSDKENIYTLNSVTQTYELSAGIDLTKYVKGSLSEVMTKHGEQLADHDGQSLTAENVKLENGTLDTVFNDTKTAMIKNAVQHEIDDVMHIATLLGVKFNSNNEPINYEGTYCTNVDAFEDVNHIEGPQQVITAISRLEVLNSENIGRNYTDIDENLSPTIKNVSTETISTNTRSDKDIYGPSVSFVKLTNNWGVPEENKKFVNGITLGKNAIISEQLYDDTLLYAIKDNDSVVSKDSNNDYYYNAARISSMGTKYDDNGNFEFYYIIFSNDIEIYHKDNEDYLVLINSGLNQEIGTMRPRFLEGYTYKHSSPNGTGMYAKLQWQHFILSTLTDYKGLRTGLLTDADLRYRYIVDTFQSFPESGLKKVFSQLAQEKKRAFVISNFPAVKTFEKCPYASFTDEQGIFNVKYVVDGYNRKKSASVRFSLPTETEGAAYIAFYTPLKFSDGYIDTIVPSAGLVSNLFMDKYTSRQPYYVVAGPNYGAIRATNLVGPDYNYSPDELNIIEPFGVNCMVFSTRKGTYINANQTAKQTPQSGLSLVNVVELCIYLQDEIEAILESYQWDFNNETVRNAIKDKADGICQIIQSNGGIQAYLNVCDTSNNNADVINNQMGVISTYIEPGYAIGKLVQRLTVYSTGKLSSQITKA